MLAAGAVRAAERYGIGRPATPQEIAGWDIDVSPSGAGLPPGRGDVRQGEAIFAAKCASCHGAHGEGKPMDRLVGGIGTIRDKKPEKTVGSFWPYATTLSTLCDAPCLLTRRNPSRRRSLCGFGLCAVPQRDRAAGRRRSTRILSPRSRCPTATASSAPIRRRASAPNPSERRWPRRPLALTCHTT